MLTVIIKVFIPVRVDWWTRPYDFCVATSLSFNILFGIDLMYIYEVKIDFFKRIASFKDRPLLSNLSLSSTELKNAARTVNSVMVKPHSEVIISENLPKVKRNARMVLLEPQPFNGTSIFG